MGALVGRTFGPVQGVNVLWHSPISKLNGKHMQKSQTIILTKWVRIRKRIFLSLDYINYEAHAHFCTYIATKIFTKMTKIRLLSFDKYTYYIAKLVLVANQECISFLILKEKSEIIVSEIKYQLATKCT